MSGLVVSAVLHVERSAKQAVEESCEIAMDESEVLQTLMRWRTRVSAAAWVVVRDAHSAEDIFQNVAVKALTNGVTFEAEGALLSWAFITARRKGIDWMERKGHQSLALDAELLELIERDWEREAMLPQDHRIERLQEYLEAVPPESRQLLKLRYFDGLGCEAVAERMNVGLNAVYKRLSRLHEALRQSVLPGLTSDPVRCGEGGPLGHLERVMAVEPVDASFNTRH